MHAENLLGWATDILVQLDDQTPGVISRVLTAAPARRNSIFAALATREGAKLEAAEAKDLAQVVRHGRPVDILRYAYGTVPTGFVGALSSIAKPLNRAADYVRLHGLLTTGQPNLVEAVRGGPLCRDKLDILSALDPRWTHINVLSRIESSHDARTFNRAVAFVQSVCSQATDGAVAEAIGRMRPTSTLPRLLQRWLCRADQLPESPVKVGDNELRPLITLRDYLDVARKYRNCLASKLDEVASGRMAIAEFRGELLVEFRPLSIGKGWVVWAMHGQRNKPVEHRVAEMAAQRCEDQGIPRLAEEVGGDNWRSYRRLLNQPIWGMNAA